MRFMKVIFSLCAMLSFGLAHAQQYRLSELEGINTTNSEIPLFRSGDSLFYLGSPEVDLLHEEDWKMDKGYALRKAIKGRDFGSFDSTVFLSDTYHAVVYNTADSIMTCFSFQDQRTKVEMFLGPRSIEERWVEERIFHASTGSMPGEFIVSYFSDESSSIDLGLLILKESEYQLIPLSTLNSGSNEVFPTWHNGDLYFSTDVAGQFDIVKATRESQWNKKEVLPSPLNSGADDLAMVFLNDEKGFISSNRNGTDDIWSFELVDEEKLIKLNGTLTVNGTALRDVGLSVYNELGELIAEVTTNEKGGFEMNVMEKEKTYTIKPGFDKRVLRSSELSLYDEEGKLVQRIVANDEGYFFFTLLPYRDGDPLERMDNPDNTTLLSIRIEGQLLDENSNPSPEGEPVFLLNDEGDAQNVTYTEDLGFFEFNNIAPKAKYTLGVPEDRENYSIVMKESTDTLKVRKKAEVVYVRLTENEVRTLKMPDGTELEFGEGEALKLRQIDYGFDSWELNATARTSLNELAEIWKLNRDVRIELQSHTDSRGTDQYNQDLSDKRAVEAINYLIQQGIPRNTLFGKGFGESMLLNGCDDNSDCSEEEHAFNRRTEVILHLKQE